MLYLLTHFVAIGPVSMVIPARMLTHVLYLLTPIAAMGPVSMVTPARMLPTKEMLPHGS